MRGFKIPLIVTLIVSLGFGIGLGIKLKRDRAAQLGVVTGSRKLKLLTLKGALPSPVLRNFAARENVQVELAEELTADAINKRLLAGADSDLVMLLTTQLPTELTTAKIQPLQTALLPGFAAVSRDFVDLPGRPSDAVPVFWGVLSGDNSEDGHLARDARNLSIEDLSIESPLALKISSASAPGRLWILNLALGTNAKNEKEAKLFLTFILSHDAAAELSALTHLSSTNALVNQSDLDSRLKASALRAFPLTNLQLVFDEAAPTVKEKKTDHFVQRAPEKISDSSSDESGETDAAAKHKPKPHVRKQAEPEASDQEAAD